MNNFGGSYDWTGRNYNGMQIQTQPSMNFGTQQPPLPTNVTGLNQNRGNYLPLQGHEIQSEENILPKDVPMDGTAGWFPAQNLSYVIMRRWNQQGTFDTVLYIPYQPEQEKKGEAATTVNLDSLMEQINARFDKIEKALTKKRYYQPKNNQMPKGEEA